MEYNLLMSMAFVAFSVAILAALIYIWPHLVVVQGKRVSKNAHLAKKAELNQIGTIDIDFDSDPKEAARKNLAFMGLPTVQAGDHLLKVPVYDPLQVGAWSYDRDVLATARAIAYTNQGQDPLEMIEMNGGYMLVSCGGKVILFKQYDLTMTQESELEKQREDAVHRNDGIIENFLGHKWRITGAFGENKTRTGGEKNCSYIQLLTLDPNHGQTGRSILPPVLLDGKEHDYYDMRARNEDTGQILYFFYTGGKWNCYIGRLLKDAERDELSAV